MQIIKDHQVNLEPSLEGARISRRAITSLKSRATMKRTWLEICADWLTGSFGTIVFLMLNIGWFIVWILFNSGILKNVRPFDPFPFGLLTMVVSLEAIFLSIIVLISQNRATKIDELRQELDLQLDLISEQEITKIMEMLAKVMEKNHLDISTDTVLKEMLKPTNTKKIEEDLKKQM